MARDAALLAAADADPAFEPLLRVYRFAPAGITLGYSQRPERELDLARCAADGVEWAVRPTGGRAIFHADDWTYALAARIDDPKWGGSLGVASKLGIYFLMVSFGAGYGYTVMSRISLLIGRFQFLLEDWLGLR